MHVSLEDLFFLFVLSNWEDTHYSIFVELTKNVFR